MSFLSLSPARKSAAPLFIYLFLLAAMGTISIPTRALFLTEELGGSKFENGLSFALPALVTLFVLPLLGDRSDRFRDRRIIISITLLIIAASFIFVSMAHTAWFFIMITLFFTPAFAAANSQFFAWAQEREKERFGDQATESGELRMGYIAGWVVAPVMGGLLLTWGLTYRNLFQLQTLAYIALAALIWAFARAKTRKPKQTGERFSWLRWRTMPKNLLFVTLFVGLVLSGDIVRLANLALYIHKNVSTAAIDVTIAFSATPLLEIPATALCIYLARRLSRKHVLAIGVIAGLIHFGLSPFTTSLGQIVILQALYAFVPASVLGVGIAYAQACAPDRMGFATSFVFAGQSLGILLGGAIAALGGLWLSIEMTYLAPVFTILLGSYIWSQLEDA